MEKEFGYSYFFHPNLNESEENTGLWLPIISEALFPENGYHLRSYWERFISSSDIFHPDDNFLSFCKKGTEPGDQIASTAINRDDRVKSYSLNISTLNDYYHEIDMLSPILSKIVQHFGH